MTSKIWSKINGVNLKISENNAKTWKDQKLGQYLSHEENRHSNLHAHVVENNESLQPSTFEKIINTLLCRPDLAKEKFEIKPVNFIDLV